jgi:type I restriction-modification system DNA methylase subunit
MNLTQIEANLQQIISNFNKGTFVYDLLLAYGQPKATITRLQQGGLNLSKVEGEIAWKKKLFFKAVENEDLHELIDNIKTNGKSLIKHDPRFIVVTNFETLLAIDSKTSDTLDIPILEIARHFDFFLPLAGMEKAQQQFENPADVKAAERMAKLYDEIKKDNPTDTPEKVHNLNVFLSRLLFCFFAEDTGIFEKSQFTHAISSHTQQDGSDLQEYLDKLFEVMNTGQSLRRSVSGVELPAYLDAFPYVNGGLFRNVHQAPVFTRRSRQVAIESGELQWKDINPDIFGSMIQAVITPEHRGGLGMHYTSVPNIMKVIEPLFLNDLYEEFDAALAKQNPVKTRHALSLLLQRIWKIKLFDPACGSGNFLIIAYKELRRLEMKIFKEIDLANKFHSNQFSGISLGNFYGIEIDDFAHEVAILSLWLAEHQMNREFFAAFGRTKPALPLKETGNIVHGNACRLDWEQVCPKKEGDEIYIMGNPPYLGSSMQSNQQKADLAFVCKGFENFKNLDYIACWFVKGANFIQNINSQFAFVSTNSICQGEQVALLWPHIFDKQLEIGFAHTSFKWTNNAKSKAAVIVIIVGIRNQLNYPKYLFSEGLKKNVPNINAYLISSSNIIFDRRSNALSNFPELVRGSMPTDGGNFTLTFEEKEKLITDYPASQKFIKRLLSGGDFLNDKERYCLWILDEDINEANSIPFIKSRLDSVKEFRLKSDAPTTVEYAQYPNRFRQIAYQESNCIVIPLTSSIRRNYIPFSFLEPGTVVTNSAGVIYDAQTWHFSVISSKMHMVWVSVVAGRLKTDYRYSSVLCYNNFPFPPIPETQKQELETHVYRILEEREKHSEKTLAQLYDPDKMPEGLREAHRQNDLAVERCYRSRPFESDEERLEYLFKLYEQMIEEEKNRGTLFAGEKKSRNRRLT